MIDTQTRANIRHEIHRVLAAHYRCDERALTDEGVTVIEASATPQHFPFPMPRKPLSIVTMGSGVVVSAHPARVPGLRATLGQMQRDDVFSARVMGSLSREIERDGQGFRGPLLTYACCREDLLPVVNPAGVAIDLYEGARLVERYAELAATSTLTIPRGGGRGSSPDVMAAVATRDGEAIGIAGASADTDNLWQIAVEVIVAARGDGVGRSVVGHLTRGILAAGKIPYYTTAMSHIGSRTLAIGLGYRPVWTGLHARDLPGARV